LIVLSEKKITFASNANYLIIFSK